LARLMRWAIVASGTRKALAISAVVRPPTARRVSATCDGGDSAGWQQRNSRVSVSSCSAVRTAPGGSSVAAVSSRVRRALSLRHWSVSRRAATVASQPCGLSGTPSFGHCTVAAISASWTASSQASKLP
jgi:hypothetical protein